MTGRVRTACPRDCPRRSAVPNCHDPARCAVWAAHLERKKLIDEARKKAETERSVMTQAREQSERRRERDFRRHRR